MKKFTYLDAVFLAPLLAVTLTFPLGGQTPVTRPDPFQSLAFLQGTWEAKSQGPHGVVADGSYSFGPELKAHVFARHAVSVAGCKGPADFDCQHGDMLTVYPEGAALKAIYFDNEGHVIHYDVTTPEPGKVVFLSDGTQPGPQFRLMYELKGGVMSGKFQMRIPGATDWRSYLEWSGGRKS